MIETNYFWLNIALLAVGTITIRGFFIALSARVKITDRTREIFTYIPAAILPAFITPAVYFHKGSVDWVAGKERLFVLLLVIAFAYFIRNTLAIVAFGLAALFLVSAI